MSILDPPTTGIAAVAKAYHPVFEELYEDLKRAVEFNRSSALPDPVDPSQVQGTMAYPPFICAPLPRPTGLGIPAMLSIPGGIATRRAIQLRKELLSEEDELALDSPAGYHIHSKLWPGVRSYVVYSSHATIQVFDRGLYLGRLEFSPLVNMPAADEQILKILELTHNEEATVKRAIFRPSFWR